MGGVVFILGGLALALASDGASAQTEPARWDHAPLYRLSPAVAPEEPLAPPARWALMALDQAPAPTAVTGWVHERSLYGIAPTATVVTIVSQEEQERTWLRQTVTEADRLMRQRQVDEALDLMRTSMEKALRPETKALLQSRLGSYLFRMQRYEEALDHMREAVRLQPEDYATACNLAAVLMSIGRTDEAFTILSGLDVTQVRSAPLLFSIFFNLACLNSLRGHPEPALQNLGRAAQVDPASTLASLGDPQLDGVRNTELFAKIRQMLEVRMAPAPPTP